MQDIWTYRTSTVDGHRGHTGRSATHCVVLAFNTVSASAAIQPQAEVAVNVRATRESLRRVTRTRARASGPAGVTSVLVASPADRAASGARGSASLSHLASITAFRARAVTFRRSRAQCRPATVSLSVSVSPVLICCVLFRSVVSSVLNLLKTCTAVLHEKILSGCSITRN